MEDDYLSHWLMEAAPQTIFGVDPFCILRSCMRQNGRPRHTHHIHAKQKAFVQSTILEILVRLSSFQYTSGNLVQNHFQLLHRLCEYGGLKLDFFNVCFIISSLTCDAVWLLKDDYTFMLQFSANGKASFIKNMKK